MSQWKGTLKIQRPITSNQVNPPVLIYNEDRSIFTEQLMTEQEEDEPAPISYGQALAETKKSIGRFKDFLAKPIE